MLALYSINTLGGIIIIMINVSDIILQNKGGAQNVY